MLVNETVESDIIDNAMKFLSLSPRQTAAITMSACGRPDLILGKT